MVSATTKNVEDEITAINDEECLPKDILIEMLKEETRIRKSKSFLELKEWGGHDINGNIQSTSHSLEMFVQQTVLKKYGYLWNEKTRNAYLTACHELNDQNPQLVKDIGAPHLIYNPFYPESQTGKIFADDIVLSDSNGQEAKITDVLKQNYNKDRETIIFTGSQT